jgi:hypothetical protein
MSTGTLPPTVALVVKLVAKPDQADEVSTFLADAVRLANQEQGTIASSLLANAERLLDELPAILPAEVLAAKLLR